MSDQPTAVRCSHACSRSVKSAVIEHERSKRVVSFEEMEPRFCLSQLLFVPHDIPDSDGGQPRSLIAADLDSDGDIDILAGAYAPIGVTWHENTDGQGEFGRQWPMRVDTDRVWPAAAADVDGDGDQDVVAVGANRIWWHENLDGSENFDQQHVIASTSHVVNSAFASDMDSDGDLDVLSGSGSAGDGTLIWHENSDGDGHFDRQHVISTDKAVRSVFAADIDEDGDQDVLAGWEGGHVDWYENTNGNGEFQTKHVVTGRSAGAEVVLAADMDGDGDIDVISRSRGPEPSIHWHDNTDGKGNFETQQVISSGVSFGPPIDLVVTDLDGDGATDILASNSSFLSDDWIGGIVWYENTGQRAIAEPSLIGTSSGIAVPVVAADIDGDGDMDVVSAPAINGKLAWYENVTPRVVTGDANRDGQFDEKDLLQVLTAAKYLTGNTATFAEGDWNHDSVFDQLDIVAALQSGMYRVDREALRTTW